MRKLNWCIIFSGMSVLLCFTQTAYAQVVLPRLIRDSMVLQRDTELTIWGWASPKEPVTVQFRGRKLKTVTGVDGKWSLTLPPMGAGGPFTMKIDGRNRLLLQDILVGDVYVCAGQSNMTHQLALHSDRYASEIREAAYPQIRQFWIPPSTAPDKPQDDLPSGWWKSADSASVLQFSAVAYFFARSIHEHYKVPIGLINASVGGTPIEAWISEEGLRTFPDLTQVIQKNKNSAYVNSRLRAMALAEASRPKAIDKGLTETKPWYDTTYAPAGWRTITVPGYWEDQGIRNLDGIVWYRKSFDVPAAMSGAAGRLNLGRIVDADVVYLNGTRIGQTGYQYPQRRYTVPKGLLKEGKNELVVQVVNHGGKGGFVPGKPYALTTAGGSIDLKGDWLYKVGAAFLPYSSGVEGLSLQHAPTTLFNAMVAPLRTYQTKGVLWYQGESNISNAPQYGALLTALIEDWRRQWKAKNLPFLFVQLPNYDDVQYLPSESPWAEIRHQQLKSLSLPHTGMAVTIDLGEWNDIHPGRKKEVGERLARAAEAVVYGNKHMVAYGPLFKSSELKENKIVIHFHPSSSALVASDGGELSEFAIAGTDKKFAWAKAKIEGDKVVVWNEAIPEPRYVRYAWADNPNNPNL